MVKNRLVALLLALVALLLAGCDNTQDLQNQVNALTAQNQALQQQIEDLTDESARLQTAASLYQGCEELGILSNLCPSNIMTEGKKALDAGFPGGGWPYWTALAGKLAVLLVSAAVALLVAWRVQIALISPARHRLKQANKTIEEAENRAQQARDREREAEERREKIHAQIRASLIELESTQEAISQRLEELAEIERSVKEKRQDLNALGGFL